jgi:hypothetical protein
VREREGSRERWVDGWIDRRADEGLYGETPGYGERESG